MIISSQSDSSSGKSRLIEYIETNEDFNTCLFHVTNSANLANLAQYNFLTSPMSMIRQGLVPRGELFMGGLTLNFGETYTCFGFDGRYNLKTCVQSYGQDMNIQLDKSSIESQINERLKSEVPAIREIIAYFAHHAELSGKIDKVLLARVYAAVDNLLNLYTSISQIGKKHQLTEDAKKHEYSTLETYSLKASEKGLQLKYADAVLDFTEIKDCEDKSCAEKVTIDEENNISNKRGFLTYPANTLVDAIKDTSSFNNIIAFSEKVAESIKGYRSSLEQFVDKYKKTDKVNIEQFPIVFLFPWTDNFKQLKGGEYRAISAVDISKATVVVTTQDQKKLVEGLLKCNVHAAL